MANLPSEVKLSKSSMSLENDIMPPTLDDHHDIWKHVASYLSDFNELLSLALTSKRLFHAVKAYSDPVIDINNDFLQANSLPSGNESNQTEVDDSRYKLQLKLPSGLVFYMVPNLASKTLTQLVQSMKSVTSLSVSKSYCINTDAVVLFRNISSVALCDNDFILTDECDLAFMQSRVAIMTNSKLHDLFFVRLMESLCHVKKTEFLGFGSISLTLPSLSQLPMPIYSDEIAIEVTFLESNVIDFLRTKFPKAIFLDLIKDPIGQLELIFQRFQVNQTMRKSLSMCRTHTTKQTPLHIAIVEKDIIRVKWLLDYMQSRVDIKNYRGVTPFHTAAVANDVTSLNAIVTSLVSKFPNNSQNTNNISKRQSSKICSLLFATSHRAETALYEATLTGCHEAVYSILSLIPDVLRNPINVFGIPKLYEFVKSNNLGIVNSKEFQLQLFGHNNRNKSWNQMIRQKNFFTTVLMPLLNEILTFFGIHCNSRITRNCKRVFQQSIASPSKKMEAYCKSPQFQRVGYGTIADMLLCDFKGFGVFHAAVIRKSCMHEMHRLLQLETCSPFFENEYDTNAVELSESQDTQITELFRQYFQ